MKKILLVLFIALVACEKGPINDLVGSRFYERGTYSMRIEHLKYPDGTPYFITFWGYSTTEIAFTTETSGYAEYRYITEVKEYASTYNIPFTYTYNPRTKEGVITSIMDDYDDSVSVQPIRFKVDDEYLYLLNDYGDEPHPIKRIH